MIDALVRKARLAVLATGLLLFAVPALAQSPRTLHYQGFLTNASGQPLSSTVQVSFALYAAPSGGSPLWSETHASVAVANGNFSVMLGSVTPVDLPFNAQYYLGITVGADAEMTPRQALAAAPYLLTGGGIQRTLSVSRTGGGTVTSSPAGLYCGASCAAAFSSSTSVTLTASPDAGATFVGWGGACSGSSATCTVTLSSDQTVSARFSYPVTVVKEGSGSGTVSSAPAGISCGATCGASYDGGTVVTLTAAAAGAAVFSGWSGSCTGTGNCVLVVDGSKTAVATFNTPSYALSVTRAGTGSGSVSSSPAGIDCGASCSATLNGGTAVTLTASPASGSTFAGWTGACSGTGSCSVTMDAAKSVTAMFTRVEYNLAVTRTGGGTVTSAPAGLYCGATCAASFGSGTVIGLTASPDTGATFVGWSGACSGTGSCSLTMDSAKAVSARFTYPLVVAKGGSGSGVVTSGDAAINCGPTCAASFDGGSTVTLTATPSANAAFAGWSGPCSGTGSCVVTVDAAKLVNATFTQNTVTLAATNSGAGSGRVTSSPAGIDCGAQCVAAFDVGTLVTLTATPTSGWSFAGWSGACSGTGTCVTTLNASQSVSATFTRVEHALSVSRTGAGLVTSSPVSIYCGAACSSAFVDGTSVTLTATPEPGATFAGWGGGACTGTGTCTVTMSAVRNVTATFTLPLSVQRTGTGSGTVTSTPAGINCGATCSATYSQGQLVTLSASPQADSTFAGWSGACSGTGSCNVTMDAAKSVVATYDKAQYLVVVNRDGNGGGSVTSTPAGVSCGPTCLANFDGGSTVSLSAVADSSSSFAGWSGACTGTGPCTLSGISSNRSVMATFVRPSYTLTTIRTGPGTLISNPSGIYCGASCSAEFSAGTLAAVTPVPDAGASFGSWAGACTGNNPSCNLTMDGNKTVSAMFGYLLTVNRTGGGGGTVTANTGGLSCGNTCSVVYSPNTSVTLTATPDANGTFIGWSGAGCSGTGACVVSMDQAKSVSATFTFPVNVTRYNNGGGSVTSNPAGIDCPNGTCSNSFVYGSVLALDATPAAGATFGAWTGCDSAAGSQCTVTVNGREDIQARFMYPLTVVSPTGGTVNGPNGMNCPSTCTVSYNYNDPVTLSAVPGPGNGFSSWSGCDSPSGTNCTMTMNGAKTVSATFSETVAVTMVTPGAGTVTSSPAGINCGATCSANFARGSTVSLTPVANGGATFQGWTGCDSVVGNTCNLSISGDKFVTATFTYPLTASITGGSGGTMTSAPSGISCPGDCSENYVAGTAVTLTQAPSAGATFSNWSGCDSIDGGNNCLVTMNSVKSPAARYTWQLTVTNTTGSTPAGTGTVTGSYTPPGGSPTACAGNCAGSHFAGTTVVLNATAAADSSFVSWTNCPSPSGSTCTLTMSSAVNVSARFDTVYYAVAVTKSGTGFGTVTSTVSPTSGNPNSINCGGTCTANFLKASTVTLTATPAGGSSFSGWSNCPSASGNTCTIANLQAARTVGAMFNSP